MSIDTHPISVVYDLGDRYGHDLQLEFSRYFYTPQSVFDQRETFQVPIGDVTPAWLASEVERLQPGWELAMNSVVLDARGRKHHVPMVDFIAIDFGTLTASAFADVVGRDVFNQLVFFSSGRSFHAYSIHLLEPGEWIRFMGRLLLLNLPKAKPLIDSRWIGHRLIGGYAALRWSANSQHHTRMPLKVSERWILQRSQLGSTKPTRRMGTEVVKRS